ncbi:MAG: VCBS repeat-containing protein [Planctomycetota bacterium]
MNPVLPLSVLSALCCAPLLSAQAGGERTLHWETFGQPGESLGYSGLNLGDMDGDGLDDFIVTTTPPTNGRPAFTVYSGATGEEIYSRTLHTVGDVSVGGGHDFDNDGVPDFAIGSPRANSVFLYSGAHGALIRTLQGGGSFGASESMGERVLMTDDLNTDGVPDVVASGLGTDSGTSQAGIVRAFSIDDGSTIFLERGGVNYDKFGSGLVEAGDWNSDGWMDFFVGARDRYVGGQRPGAVYLLSGIDGNKTLLQGGLGDDDAFGTGLALLDDLNNDGFPELLVAASERDTDPGFENRQGGYAVLSGVDFSVLRTEDGQLDEQQMGYEVGVCEDYDNDGVREYLVSSKSSATYPSGVISMYSGATGLLLHNFELPNAQNNGRLGSFVICLDDLDGDSKSEFLAGDPKGGTGNMGSIHRFSFDSFFSVDGYTASAANGQVVNFTLNLPTAAAGLDYKVLVSAAGIGPVTFGVDIPVSPDSFVTDSYGGNYPLPTTNLHGILDANGDGSGSATFPAGLAPNFIGRSLYFAAIAEQAGFQPAYSTTPISVTIVP